jgi:iron-sulfur cluster assembly protein
MEAREEEILMLMVTDNAATAIRSLVNDKPGLPNDAGLRVTGSPDGPAGVAISRDVTARRGDQVIEQHGARIFLDPTAASPVPPPPRRAPHNSLPFVPKVAARAAGGRAKRPDDMPPRAGHRPAVRAGRLGRGRSWPAPLAGLATRGRRRS